MNSYEKQNIRLESYSISRRLKPEGFDYPGEFGVIVRHGFVDLNPWYVMETDRIDDFFLYFKELFPNTTLIPFARKEGFDDFVCFGVSGEVVSVDLEAKQIIVRKDEKNMWDWLKVAISDMRDYHQLDQINDRNKYDCDEPCYLD